MSYLIERLQRGAGGSAKDTLMLEAAAELERLGAENERLRSIANSDDGAGGDGMRLVLENTRLTAENAALRAQALDSARAKGSGNG